LLTKEYRSNAKSAWRFSFAGNLCRVITLLIFFASIRSIVEAKAVNALTDIDRAQLIDYLEATAPERGRVLNFAQPGLQYERLVLSPQSAQSV
jgi:GxxExxY protein